MDEVVAGLALKADDQDSKEWMAALLKYDEEETRKSIEEFRKEQEAEKTKSKGKISF